MTAPTPLEGHVAMVTGAGDGIGRAVAFRLCQAGAVTAVLDINAAAASDTVSAIEDKGQAAAAYTADVADCNSMRSVVSQVVARHGRLDLLVNNAGFGVGGPSLDVTEEAWDRAHGVMLRGAFFAATAAAAVMIPQGGGSIVNICSRSGVGGYAERALYSSAKAGLISLTQVLGVEWARHGIRVNGVNPGQIETPTVAAVATAGLFDFEVLLGRTPQGRMGSPEDIAEAVMFLASEDARDITAEILTVDGGWLAWGGIEEPAGAY